MLLLSFRIYYGFGEFGLPFLSGFRLTHRPFSLTTFFRFPFFYRKGNNFVVAGLTRPGYWYGIQLPTNPNVHSGWFEKVTLALQQYVQKNFHWSGQYNSIAVLIRKIHHNRRSGGLCCNNHQLMLVFSHLLSRII